MITIQLDSSIPAAAVARVRQILDDTAARDIGFNGVKFEVVFGDYTGVLSGDGLRDVPNLFNAIQDEIAGIREVRPGWRRLSNGEAFETGE